MQTTGLIGHPVAHSLSPKIHSYWLRQHGIEGAYCLYDIAPEALAEGWEKLKKTPLRGLNVTVPHKQAVMALVGDVDDTARTIGAVNTITCDNGTWHGSNTDAYGFITHLKHAQPDNAELFQHTVVLGAGGAARAAVYALKQEGAARITIINRTYETAAALAQECGVEASTMDGAAHVFATASLLTNTTSAGMKANAPLVLPMEALPAQTVVYDIVYAPLVTPLLADAAARGLATVDGLGMLLYQAQKAFALWWGVTPEVTEELRTYVLKEMPC